MLIEKDKVRLNLIKKVFITTKFFSLIGIIISLGYYIYVRNIWSNFITEKDFNNLVVDIKIAQKLPKGFYYFYDKLSPNTLKWTSNELLFNKLVSDDYHFNSPSTKIAFYINNKFRRRYKFKEFQTSLSWKLEKEVSQKECLNWIAKEMDFLNNQTGIENAISIKSSTILKLE